MKIDLCLTTYNRTDMTIESFSGVYNHPKLDEIHVVDDFSTDENFRDLVAGLVDVEVSNGNKDKIIIHRNKENLGMSRNKKEAVSKGKNEWKVLFDSDNILYPEYLDAIPEDPQPDVIYQPSECESEYTFKQFEGMIINKGNAKDLLHIREFRIMLNQCNYLVNRQRYLEVYKYDPTIKESDTIYFNHLWLAAGYSFYVTPGMKYYHRRHEDSGWLKGDHKYNMKKADEIQELIKLM